MTVNRFDQASRYCAKLDAAGFLHWLLHDPSLIFDSWLDTRSLPFPGEEDRTCDTVAHLIDPVLPQAPWAVPVEFQTRPDGACSAVCWNTSAGFGASAGPTEAVAAIRSVRPWSI